MLLNDQGIIHALAGKSRIIDVCKQSDDGAVVETDDSFVKVKKIDVSDHTHYFDQIISESYARVYQELGLDWSVSNFSIGDEVFRVEKRHKLTALQVGDLSYEEALLKSDKFKKRVEKRLELPRLFAQVGLDDYFLGCNKLVLARDCDEDITDFAFFGDEVICLGESGWFLAFLDESKNWKCLHGRSSREVTLSYGDFFLSAKTSFHESSMLGGVFLETSKWWLFPKELGDMNALRQEMAKESKDMFSTNIKILANKRIVPVKTRNDFGNMAQEMKRLGLIGLSHKSLPTNEEA